MDTASATVTGVGRRISASNPIYGQIVDFLVDEAWLLDQGRDDEWLALVDSDIIYRMPQRQTVYRRDGTGFAAGNFIFDDKLDRLKARVRRNAHLDSALDRDPLPGTRRLISNVRVDETSADGEYKVASSFLFTSHRFSGSDAEKKFVTGTRDDLIRRIDGGFKLARRTVLIDQAGLEEAIWNILL